MIDGDFADDAIGPLRFLAGAAAMIALSAQRHPQVRAAALSLALEPYEATVFAAEIEPSKSASSKS
ncbi:MAG: hypothetical protein WKF48_08430 [Solirubrobacteraceae bacterium]